MGKERKSPEQKKRLEYERDHFTFGFNSSRAFPKVWKRKKARVNRAYRHKADALLSSAKHALEKEDIDNLAEDLTPARLQKSVTRKRLRKTGTVSLSEKVKIKQEHRARSTGRRRERERRDDRTAEAAVRTISSLRGTELLDFARRAEALCGQRDTREFKRVLGTQNAINSALDFLRLVCIGSFAQVAALRRNPGLNEALQSWIEKANRIITSDLRRQQEVRRQKEAARLRIKNFRKQS